MNSKKRAGSFIRYIVFAVSLIMIFVGTRTGEIMTVFQKAAYICLECIGIG